MGGYIGKISHPIVKTIPLYLLLVFERICKTYAKNSLGLNLVVLSLVVVELEVNLSRDILASLDVDGVLPTNGRSDALEVERVALVSYVSIPLVADTLLSHLVDPTVE